MSPTSCSDQRGVWRTDSVGDRHHQPAGIYVHSAPWSLSSQGYSNVSHGCLNVSPGTAVWFHDTTKRGDIVEVVNTGGSTLPGTDGLGDWNIPWEQGRAGNANI